MATHDDIFDSMALQLRDEATPAVSLRIDSHQVHRIDGEDDLVVTTLKDITLSVVLVGQHDEVLPADMPISAHPVSYTHLTLPTILLV